MYTHTHTTHYPQTLASLVFFYCCPASTFDEAKFRFQNLENLENVGFFSDKSFANKTKIKRLRVVGRNTLFLLGLKKLKVATRLPGDQSRGVVVLSFGVRKTCEYFDNHRTTKSDGRIRRDGCVKGGKRG